MTTTTDPVLVFFRVFYLIKNEKKKKTYQSLPGLYFFRVFFFLNVFSVRHLLRHIRNGLASIYIFFTSFLIPFYLYMYTHAFFFFMFFFAFFMFSSATHFLLRLYITYLRLHYRHCAKTRKKEIFKNLNFKYNSFFVSMYR